MIEKDKLKVGFEIFVVILTPLHNSYSTQINFPIFQIGDQKFSILATFPNYALQQC